jgi:predicted amidophosphoribosyltransferase
MEKGVCHRCHKDITFGDVFCKECFKIIWELIKEKWNI